MQLQIKQVNTQGQISVGKKFAGQQVQVEEYPDGSVLLTPVTVITKLELDLMRDEMFQKRLVEFDRWQLENGPVATNLDRLEENRETWPELPLLSERVVLVAEGRACCLCTNCKKARSDGFTANSAIFRPQPWEDQEYQYTCRKGTLLNSNEPILSCSSHHWRWIYPLCLFASWSWLCLPVIRKNLLILFS